MEKAQSNKRIRAQSKKKIPLLLPLKKLSVNTNKNQTKLTG